MNSEVIDEMTVIIASLNSRLDELESARKLCKWGASNGRASNSLNGSTSAARQYLTNDSVIYQGNIDTLTKQNDELAHNNEKFAEEVRKLTTENIMLTHKYETLNAEYQVAVCTEYCSVCWEVTHHENNFCIQCLIIEQDAPTDDAVESVQHDVEERVNSALGVATVPIVPTTANIDEKQGDEFSISRDEIIAGYQKLILALTHKLAEAYGVSEK